MVEKEFKKAEQACSLIGEYGIAQSKIKEFSLKVQEIKARYEIMSKRPYLLSIFIGILGIFDILQFEISSLIFSLFELGKNSSLKYQVSKIQNPS